MEADNIQSGSLCRGTDTFTLDRLDAILKSERFSYDHRNADPPRFSEISYAPLSITAEVDTSFPQFESLDGGIRCFSKRDTELRATKFCKDLCGDGNPASISVPRLDATFSKFFTFKFEPLEDSQAIVERASDLLERLPAWPLELDDTPTECPSDYHACSIAGTSTRDAKLWEQLQATKYVSSNVLRVALLVVMEQGCAYSLRNVTDIIAALIEIASQLASTVSDDASSWRLFIARAFLWTSWQRCQMLYFHLQATDYLVLGSPDRKIMHLNLRGTLISPKVTIHDMSRQRASLEKPAYMCSWNFELLRTNSVCIGADFRRFHQRYKSAFGGYPARCLAGQLDACKGDSPKSCRRFQGMVIKDQSAHDLDCCKNCRQLIWDETSYRSLSGARAVSLGQTESDSSGTWQYCNASDQTLAISHVWSHGQGGRPETGFNHCLHLRYSGIARSLGCDSYWIDTTCIPNDHQLRAESIAKINEVFTNAKVMLVCDEDIMEIDISNMTITVCETLLVTAIVCDWNVRAWTFLEAFRARRTIHLLCKNNAVVPLLQVIETVERKGALDIAILLLAMPHFLPPQDDRVLASPKSMNRESFQAGYLPVEISGSLLSYRTASREGDDFVIWSLLMSEKTIFYNAEAFWRSMQGLALQSFAKTGEIYSSATKINVDYLISSAPRLKTRGLGWAPASPGLESPTHSQRHSLYEMNHEPSAKGWITVDGLVADWWICKFEGTGFLSMENPTAPRLREQCPESQCPRNLAKIRDTYLQGYRWGAILQPPENPSAGNWWESSWRLGESSLVVCGSKDTTGSIVEKYTFIDRKWDENKKRYGKDRWDENMEALGWQWRGVYLWDEAEPLPHMQMVKKLLVV